jgi:predicted nucleic acid-binding Zn ribbon protein
VYKGLGWYDVDFHSSREEKEAIDSSFNFVDLLFLI